MPGILITGTSSGIGLATALELARAGNTVYATMRNPVRAPQLAEQAAAENLPIHVLQMDVDSDESVATCFASLTAPLDVLVNNAGIERHGAIEELSLADIRAIMETNYFGAIRCIHQVVKPMRERGSGCIVNVASVSGKISSSPLGAYAASKFALEALSEALAQEMKPFGVRVAIVEPGIIDTPMAQSIKNPPPSAYRQINQLASLFRASLQHPTPPSVVAEVIRGIIENPGDQLRYPAGPDAAPLMAWRASMTDQQWTEFNSLDDAAWRAAVRRDFGLELEL